ncbi:hypothetical protein VE01_04425 [Pseudogymnoascus verrucosus]|uniref:Aminoglycoside phosphotransferase domain-containing protein n=1 Tax=Pseudogymnoascus verrucosus TaxID=342668 RepID=A0A1B8GPB9_9PEZI|nr:uncharacterized protein VE01_04425 [Pseudogymnoascus verrucosus]OBT97664.1 hypothetical protein VE01_04425 [Pseudogymnoascus verrucosus]
MPPRTRRLPREDITYSVAQDREVNVLHQLEYCDKKDRFFDCLYRKRNLMQAVVAHHLSLQLPDACNIADMSEWLHGSFNVCVPVTISAWQGKRVLLRFPLPYRVGDSFQPGNGDEKIRCEAGTYAWLDENCPEVPIPRLYGFALSTGQTFTRLESLPFVRQYIQRLRRHVLSWLGYPVPSRYVRHDIGRLGLADAGYLLTEYIEETQGEMLSNTWLENQHDSRLRTNLFHDLSRIILSISRIALPRIGSFVIDNDGFLSLTNRPLSIEIQTLENEEVPTNIRRDYTYTTVDSYIVDMLAFHDNRLRIQPNAINDIDDSVSQMSALGAMRTIMPLFLRRELRRGPFVFTLTDLHQSNIFVDKDWHITSLVDLEWGCSRPIEMVEPPYWLTNKGVDQILPDEYNKVRVEFMTILEEEELLAASNTTERGGLRLADVMNQAWEMGTFWYTLALSSPTGLFRLFYHHIQPRLISIHDEDPDNVMPYYWAQNVFQIISRKLSDKKEYDLQLRKAFDDSTIE